MIILGLDASTSTVGWAFNKDNLIIAAGFIDIKKIKNNKDKCFKVINKLKSNKYINQISYINLEAALSGYAGGFTKQQTIITLTRFNALLEYILSEHYKVPVNLLSVNTMRKKLFGKCRIPGINSKKFVKEQLEAKYPYIKKFCAKNKKGNWDVRNSDMYDAIVCAYFK